MIDETCELEISVPDNHLSFSRIRTFDSCQYKFYLQYIEKAKGLISIPMLLGSSFHLGQEHGIKAMIEKATPKPKEVVEVAVENLKVELKKNDRQLDFDEFDSSKSLAQDDLKTMTAGAYQKISTSFYPIESEQSFELKLDDKTKLTGRVDVVEFQAESGEGITELKTTKRLPALNSMFDFQTSIYKIFRRQAKWIKKFFVIRRQNKNRNMEIHIFKKEADTELQSRQGLGEIIKYKKNIENATVNGFAKTINLQTCSFCQFRFGCRPEIFNNKNGVTNIGVVKIQKKEINKNANIKRVGNIVRLLERQGDDGSSEGIAYNNRKGGKLPSDF